MAKLGSWGRARKVEILRRMPLFATCSARELAQVAALTVQGHLEDGAVLTREGRAGGLAYMIESGTADVVRDGRQIASLGPGDMVGELSLLDGRSRTATVRAVGPLEVLEINAVDLRRLLDRAPHVRRKVLEAMAERLRLVDALPTAL